VDGLLPQLILVAALIAINAVFAGTELALVSLREGQLLRLEAGGRSGAVLARLARDPNRFLATIQIVITLSGFFASASAAVTLAEPLAEEMSFFGDAALPVAIALVTLLISYVTLVFGELAPKRLAMQRAEGWGLLMARPLSLLAKFTTPVVWLLSRSADIAVRLAGGDPSRQREDVTEEELRDLIASQTSFSQQQRVIISGVFDISERTLRQILLPRREVVVLDNTLMAADGVGVLMSSGHSRAPVATDADLDQVSGVVHLRDLIGKEGTVAALANPPLIFPETVMALDALREMQRSRQHLAVVVGEHGTGEGIVTIEDLIEELVGEIYDESDRDVLSVERAADGSIELPGGFPVHDLIDIGVNLPQGDYTTVAGLILSSLGRLPRQPGEQIVIEGWELSVLAMNDRAITRVRLRQAPSSNGPDSVDSR